MTIRALQVGLGPIGVAVARQLVDRRGYELVGAATSAAWRRPSGWRSVAISRRR
jgi:hypothetical protein